MTSNGIEEEVDIRLIAGIDVGGTFTDLLLVDRNNGDARVVKTLSTPGNQAFGVLNALDETGIALADLDAVIHGTTTTTNAVLERKLAPTGMITTRGFRDVIELGRRTRPQPYGMFGVFQPVISRDRRLEVTERMDAQGNIVVPLDVDGVRHAARQLLEDGCESLVIHFLHSYANPDHERRAVALLREIWPNDYITAGHELLSEYREYERGVTAAVNASVRPLLHRYVDRLQTELSAKGFRRDLLVMNGNGGMVSGRQVDREAAKTVMSGPASGVMAAAYTAKRCGFEKLITYDMGGTSTDVALVFDAIPAVSSELELEYAMPIHVPMVDVRTIGSGGGSIAFIDDAGLLRVGPLSAGAQPGPICYSRGGTVPTITDANLLLGRLNPVGLLATDCPANVDNIRNIIAQTIGEPLKLNAEKAAGAILRIANDRMAGAIRMVSLAKGHDPRDFTLFAFGGAGPLHATALARELAIPRVLIPGRPGITNALGCVVADLRHDFVHTVNRPLDDVDIDTVQNIFAQQVAEGQRIVESEGVGVENVTTRHGADMQFIGQTHLIDISLPDSDASRADIQNIFEASYFERFQVDLPEIKASLINLKTSVIGVRQQIELDTLIEAPSHATTFDFARTGVRDVWFEGKWRETPIFARNRLPIDDAFDGPAIIEQMDTTIVIEPGNRVVADKDGNLLVHVGVDT
ncbi:MAG: hydantoinase/oxoprolinase family protein [Pseudomonadota bacterium]|nr:hydantoinase/oxoprolinase family protein [Pseudomonadota bacterium]